MKDAKPDFNSYKCILLELALKGNISYIKLMYKVDPSPAVEYIWNLRITFMTTLEAVKAN